MSKLIIKYKSIDPYYSDFEETYIDSDLEKCWEQALQLKDWWEHRNEKLMGRTYKQDIKEIE